MWIITKDSISDDKRREGARSVNFKEGVELPFKFRMRDDDGETYYEGMSSSNSSFAPLDYLGTPDAGCTEIQYLNSGIWETL